MGKKIAHAKATPHPPGATSTPPTPPMRIAQAANLLGVSTTTLYKDAKAGADGITVRGGAYHVDFPRYNAWRKAQGLLAAQPLPTSPDAASDRSAPLSGELPRGGRPSLVAAPAPTVGGKTMADVRLEREALELERERLSHDEERGRLVPAEDVLREWTKGLSALQLALDEAPHAAVEMVRASLNLTPPQAAELARAIQTSVRATLDRFVSGRGDEHEKGRA